MRRGPAGRQALDGVFARRLARRLGSVYLPIMRVDPTEFRSLELRAHEFLSAVPLHDVWSVRLRGAAPDLTISEVLARLEITGSGNVHSVGRVLFWIRSVAGRAFGWDGPAEEFAGVSYAARVTAQDREQSLEEPGTPTRFGTAVYTFEREALWEIINRTVHAFVLFVLVPRGSEATLYWAVYVAPVSRLTKVYMAVIDAFRRWLIYPSMARRFEAAWEADGPAARGP
ncbi:MAG: DUF2867 domain-containing protein [Longimicrobiales bacterium]